MCTDILDMASEQINNEKIIFHCFSRSLFFYPSKAGHSSRSAHLSYHSIQTTFVPEGLTIKPQTHYIPRSTSSPQQEKIYMYALRHQRRPQTATRSHWRCWWNVSITEPHHSLGLHGWDIYSIIWQYLLTVAPLPGTFPFGISTFWEQSITGHAE